MEHNLAQVRHVLFGKNTFLKLPELLESKKINKESTYKFLVDDIFKDKLDEIQFPKAYIQDLIWVSAEKEPYTEEVNRIVDHIQVTDKEIPEGIIGIGGGTVMDYAKAVAVMLKNPGMAEDYQGLNLVKNDSVWCVCIPTLSGTGAEVSRTAVLTGPTKKLGIKSNYTMPNQVILDPILIREAPHPQKFYTGMDCYFHSVEALKGICKNALCVAYTEQAINMCKDVFLERAQEQDDDTNEKLMAASYIGGLGVLNGEVGVCHALSYGLSYVLNYKHGFANCICFNVLEDYYGKYVEEFQQMMIKNKIQLPQHISKDWNEDILYKMAKAAYELKHMWRHALGEEWEKILTLEKLIELYKRL